MRAALLVLVLLWGCQPAEPEAAATAAAAEASADAAVAEARAREAEARAREAEAQRPAPARPAAEPTLVYTEPEIVYAEPEVRTGDWFVVVGGARNAADPAISARQRQLDRAGVTDTHTIDSDAYPNLNPGLTVLVIGPMPQAEARSRLRGVRGVVPDAYIKSGW